MESFVSRIGEFTIEMKWQSAIGCHTLWLKTLANQWNMLSWLNFTFIIVINLMFILFLNTNTWTGNIEFGQEW
jgi:hypothetical protein